VRGWLLLSALLSMVIEQQQAEPHRPASRREPVAVSVGCRGGGKGRRIVASAMIAPLFAAMLRPNASA
jgi:hypothetical protein